MKNMFVNFLLITMLACAFAKNPCQESNTSDETIIEEAVESFGEFNLADKNSKKAEYLAEKLDVDKMNIAIGYSDNLPNKIELLEYFGLQEGDYFNYKVVCDDKEYNYICYLDRLIYDQSSSKIEYIGFVSDVGVGANWIENLKYSRENGKIIWDNYNEKENCFVKNNYKAYIEKLGSLDTTDFRYTW